MLDEGDKMLDDGFEEEVVLIAAEDRVLMGWVLWFGLGKGMLELVGQFL